MVTCMMDWSGSTDALQGLTVTFIPVTTDPVFWVYVAYLPSHSATGPGLFLFV